MGGCKAVLRTADRSQQIIFLNYAGSPIISCVRVRLLKITKGSGSMPPIDDSKINSVSRQNGRQRFFGFLEDCFKLDDSSSVG